MRDLFCRKHLLVMLVALVMGLAAGCGGDDGDDEGGGADVQAGEDTTTTPGEDTTTTPGEDTTTTPGEDTVPQEDTAESSGGCNPVNEDALQWEMVAGEEKMNWDAATAYCENLELDGHTDWRLPTLCELRSIIDGCPKSMLGGQCKPGDKCLTTDCWSVADCTPCVSTAGPTDGCYWKAGFEGPCTLAFYPSSQLGEDMPEVVWGVRFDIGQATNAQSGPNGKIYVRCVRDL